MFTKKWVLFFLHHTLMTFHSTSCVHLMRSPIEYMAIRSKLKHLFWKNKNNKNEMIELASGFLMTTKQMRTEAIIGLPWWRLLTINYISNKTTTWLFPLQLMLLLLHFLTSPRYTSNYNLRQALFYLSLIHICNFGFVRWCTQ